MEGSAMSARSKLWFFDSADGGGDGGGNGLQSGQAGGKARQ